MTKDPRPRRESLSPSKPSGGYGSHGTTRAPRGGVVGGPSVEELADALYRLPGIENRTDTIEVLADNLHALLNGRRLFPKKGNFPNRETPDTVTGKPTSDNPSHR